MNTPVEEAVIALLEAWNARDLDRFVGMLDNEIEWYDPGMPAPPAHGRAAVKAFAESALRAFPDFKYEILPPLCVSADGSRCTAHWRITATHTGMLNPPGFAPTNRTAVFDGIDQLDFRAGRVVRILTLFDPLAAGGQLLGMNLRPPAGSAREWFAVRFQRLLAWRARRTAPRKMAR